VPLGSSSAISIASSVHAGIAGLLSSSSVGIAGGGVAVATGTQLSGPGCPNTPAHSIDGPDNRSLGACSDAA